MAHDSMRIWVDTDFGFDDLWAMLLLQYAGVDVDGVSLVAGNTPLPQVSRNAEAAKRTFGFQWPVFLGAAKPLHREQETAEHILGQFGMGSRGRFLPYSDEPTSHSMDNGGAIDAIKKWIIENRRNHIIALGPLTNLATLIAQHPRVASAIEQITWLGGSRGRGNHSPVAEFNALADAEALSIVAKSQIPLRIIDLELCRTVWFEESHIPDMCGKNRQLVSDLLGGYLDIALHRGRMGMSIYDPLVALSVVKSDLFQFTSASIAVQLEQGAEYGRTIFDTTVWENAGIVEIGVSVDSGNARNTCLAALVNA